MGCNICQNNTEYLYEKEIKPSTNQINQKDNKNIPSTSENKSETKANISSPNLKIKKDFLNNINKNNNDIIKESNNNNIINLIDKDNDNNKDNRELKKQEDENKILQPNKNDNNSGNQNIVDVSKILSSNKKDYDTRVIDLINEIRSNPSEYSRIIINNIQYISKEIKIEANDETGQNEEKEEIFFQKKVKVKLYKGEKAFIEAADNLKYMEPMKELIYKEEIKLNIPNNKDEMNDNNFIKEQLIEIRKNNNISAFFKDSVKNPEVGVLLMIVGDYNNSQNKKRNAILNPEYKYIAVSSKFIGDLFIAYYTFSK